MDEYQKVSALAVDLAQMLEQREEVVTDEASLKKSGIAAIQNYASRFSVAIRPTPSSTANEWVGSGTVVRTPGGKLVVLSAKHVLEEIAKIDGHVAVGFGPTGISIPSDGVCMATTLLFGPEGVDVGLFVLNPTAATYLADSISVNDIGSSSDTGIEEGDAFVAVGYPWQLVHDQADYAAHVNWHFFSKIIYTVKVRGLDRRGRYEMNWNNGIAPQEASHLLPNLAAQLVSNGGPHVPPDPPGVSGGALWRFRGPPRLIWTASAYGKLVGVLCSWIRDDRIQIAESASAWGDWLRAAIKELDGGAITEYGPKKGA
jgi:hypothetical protein